MVVVGDQWPTPNRDSVYLQKVAQGPGILGHQDICSGQHIKRTQGDVPGGSDGCRDQMEPRRNGAQGRFVRTVSGVRALPHKFTSPAEPITLTCKRSALQQ
jgi:hypothetical protein